MTKWEKLCNLENVFTATLFKDLAHGGYAQISTCKLIIAILLNDSYSRTCDNVSKKGKILSSKL